MQIQITARHFTASAKLQEHVQTKLSKLEKFYDGITDARVILSQPGGPVEFNAEVTLNVYKQALVAESKDSSYELALDGCVERLRRQLKRYKDRLRDTGRDEHR
jgi:putative sigma-54 modulation protein